MSFSFGGLVPIYFIYSGCCKYYYYDKKYIPTLMILTFVSHKIIYINSHKKLWYFLFVNGVFWYVFWFWYSFGHNRRATRCVFCEGVGGVGGLAKILICI